MTATVEPRAEDGSIQSHRRSQRRLTASRCDGASATVDTVAVTSKAARTRKRRGAGTRLFASRSVLTVNHMVQPDSTSIVLADREATAKWLRVQLPMTRQNSMSGAVDSLLIRKSSRGRANGTTGSALVCRGAGDGGSRNQAVGSRVTL
jgi:hypothetical protein